VQVSVLDPAGNQLLNRGCRNDWEQIVKLTEPLGVVKRVAIEACCGAADLAEELITKAGWPVEMAHPQYVARMKQSPDKTDFSDGRLLADLTRVGYLPKVWLPSAHERDLRQLVNHRQNLIDQRRAAKLRIGAVLREHRAQAQAPTRLSRWTRLWVAWARSVAPLSPQARWIVNELMDEVEHLDKRIRAVDTRLREASGDDSLLKKLMKEPGIGEVTAWALRAFVGRFDRFSTGKQLSRYCGLSPCNASSGTRQADAGLVRGCNRLLRAILIQAGHRLIRTEKRWTDLARTMRGRGKPACVVVAAVANRWMRGLWHRINEEKVTAN
jgi:transposase